MSQQEISQTDQTIYQYLKSRGFHQTESQFLSELQSHSHSQTQTQTNNTNTLDQYIFSQQLLDSTTLNPAYTQESPQYILDSYQSLLQYIEESLDLYKSELKLFAFPIWLHLYIDLLSRGFISESQYLLKQYKKDYEEQYPAEVKQLESLTNPKHLDENQLIKNYRTNKYIIQLSSYAFELLISFLMDRHYISLLKIVNQYLNVRVYGTQPRGEQESLGVVGMMSQQLNGVNTGDVFLGRVSEDPLFMEILERRLKLDGLTVPTTNTTGNNTTTGTSTTTGLSTSELVPHPPRTNQDIIQELEALRDLKYRIHHTQKHKPSILCFTFHHTNRLSSITINHDLSKMASGSLDSTIKVWSLNGLPLRSLKGGTEYIPRDFEDLEKIENGLESGGGMYKSLIGHHGPVYDLSFSRNQKYLLSCSEDGSARLWGMHTYTNLVSYKAHSYPIWSCDFSNDSVYFVTGSHDRTAKVFSVERPYPLRILSGHLSDVECVKYHPNGEYILTASIDRTVRMWDCQRGKCVRLLNSGSGVGHPSYTKSITALAVSKCGSYCVSGGDDGTICIWDLSSAKLLKTYKGTSSVLSLEYDGVISVGFMDGSVRVYDLEGLVFEGFTKRTPVQSIRVGGRGLICVAGVFEGY